ncbi:hypothetical protein STEG23_000156 [Scotinomys teguina]
MWRQMEEQRWAEVSVFNALEQSKVDQNNCTVHRRNTSCISFNSTQEVDNNSASSYIDHSPFEKKRPDMLLHTVESIDGKDFNKSRYVLIRHPDSKDVINVIPNPDSVQLSEILALVKVLVECYIEPVNISSDSQYAVQAVYLRAFSQVKDSLNPFVSSMLLIQDDLNQRTE